jgi:hypothetical protein
LNSYLRKNGGYDGLKVNWMVALVWARKVMDIDIGYKTNISVEEAQQRGLKVQSSVKNKGHWVSEEGYHIDPGKPYKTIIMDPAGGRHRYLEDYSGVDRNNTRCFYRKKGATKTTGTSISMAEKAFVLAASNDSETNFGFSSLFVHTESPVAVCLMNENVKIACSDREFLENAQTGETVDTGTYLETDNLRSGCYNLIVTGQPGTAYSLNIKEFDCLGEVKTKTLSGTIPQSGEDTIKVSHLSGIITAKLTDLMNEPDGASIQLSSGMITGLEGKAIRIQDSNIRVPTIKVKSPYPNGYLSLPGYAYKYRIADLRGKMGTENGQRVIYCSDPITLDSGIMPKPVGVSPQQVQTTAGVYCKTWGRITSIDSTNKATLEGQLKFALSLSYLSLPTGLKVGDMVTVVGIYSPSDKMFYVGEQKDISLVPQTVQ